MSNNYPYQSRQSAEKHVHSLINKGCFTLTVDAHNFTWLHPNPDGEYENGSVYGASCGDVVCAFAVDRARVIGYDWPNQ